MNNEYQFLSNIFEQWKYIVKRQIKNREITMQIIYKNEQNQLYNTFKQWIKLAKGKKNYQYKRDLFYKKLLIFNYKYILKKYFNAFVQLNRRLTTLHYKKEMANNFRSQQLINIKRNIFKALKFNVEQNHKVKTINFYAKKLFFKQWKQETRKIQLTNKLNYSHIELNNVEKWVQQKRNTRLQPKINNQCQEILINKQNENYENNKQKQQSIQQQPIQQQSILQSIKSINELNEYLKLKMMEYEFYTKQPQKNIPLIKQIKLEIQQTLEQIQNIRQITQ